MRRVLIIGAGGREHAIAWKISQSKLLGKLFCAPGNPGTSQVAQNLAIDIKDFKAIKQSVLENNIDMVVVGPEEPLVNGLRDFFLEDKDLKEIFFTGPSAHGAMLEGSKDFAKSFMIRHGIPTAKYNSFNIESLNEGYEYLESINAPYVLKADGLAAGKGVLILDNLDEAKRELSQMLNGKFGKAGNRVVIEEFLSGIELSAFVLTDGNSYMILPEAKDYKRIGENDTGLNTGGMGAVSPVPFANPIFMKKVEEQVIIPTIEGLKKDNIDYNGFIFIGLMNCKNSPYVIEYNVRLGDPETEAIMPRIKSDLLSHLIAAGNGKLAQEKLETNPATALTMVLVSGGYPNSFEKGYPIEIGSKLKETTLFHSGTKLEGTTLVTNGGRVFALTTLANNIPECRKINYDLVNEIKYQGKYYRKDIGLDLIDK